MTPVAREASLGVHGGQPLGELGLEVGAVVEPAAHEEAVLDPAGQIVDGALLLAAPRPTKLGGEAVVQRNLAKHGVPNDQLAQPLQHEAARLFACGESQSAGRADTSLVLGGRQIMKLPELTPPAVDMANARQ